jgi:hypothetical protein
MTDMNGAKNDGPLLEIALDRSRLPVSNLSSLLRVLQAALREVARGFDEGRRAFAGSPYPVLVTSTATEDDDLVLRFHFEDTVPSTPSSRLSTLTFTAFLEEFKKLYIGQPQRGLWGEAVVGSQRRAHESDAARRVDEVRMELQRFDRARLTFDRQTVRFEGDRMEMGQ